jgi:hypothetical protein
MLASARICCEFKSNHILDVSGVVGKKTRPLEKTSAPEGNIGAVLDSGVVYHQRTFNRLRRIMAGAGNCIVYNGGMKFRGAGEDLPYTLIPFDQLSPEQRAAVTK